MKEIILKYRDKNIYDFSCSETILKAATDYYNLNLDDSSFKMMAPFSGGMYEGEVCGILTGAIAVLGILFTEGVSHTSQVLREAVIDYKSEFKKRFSSKECSILIQTKRDEFNGCSDFIVEGAELLVEVVKKYGE